jgi:hypothetical protein
VHQFPCAGIGRPSCCVLLPCPVSAPKVCCWRRASACPCKGGGRPPYSHLLCIDLQFLLVSAHCHHVGGWVGTLFACCAYGELLMPCITVCGVCLSVDACCALPAFIPRRLPVSEFLSWNAITVKVVASTGVLLSFFSSLLSFSFYPSSLLLFQFAFIEFSSCFFLPLSPLFSFFSFILPFSVYNFHPLLYSLLSSFLLVSFDFFRSDHAVRPSFPPLPLSV